MNNSLSFKMKYSSLIACIFIGGTLLFTGLIISKNGTSINWLAYGSAVIGVLLFSVIWAFVIVHYYKTTLKNEGINGFNFWGKYHFFSWSDITRVKPINFFGLKYLRVYSSILTLPLWVPLFFNDMKYFKEKIRSLPPEGNVLRKYYSK